MIKKFDLIVADCPWSFKDKLQQSSVKRGASSNYGVMTISEIQQLPVKNLCAPTGAVLCLWVPGSLLQEGLDTLKAWGFTHKQTYVWVKTKKQENLDNAFYKAIKKILKPLKAGVPLSMILSNYTMHLSRTLSFGMGRLFRQTHELCLIGTSNNKVYQKLQNKSQRSVCFASNLKHSAKPEDLQDALEVMFPRAKKMELFARRVRSGWTCLGNEIDGKDIRDALAELK